MLKKCIFFGIFIAPQIVFAGWRDFLVPDPSDVFEDAQDVVRSLVSGDACEHIPECAQIDFSVAVCLVDKDPSACAISLISPNHIHDCRIAGLGISMLYQHGSVVVGTYKSNLGDLIGENGIDSDVHYIFDVLLDTPGFASYARKNVSHFYSAFEQDGGGSGDDGKTTGNLIFYDVEKPASDLITHELTHVWQYYRDGLPELADSVCAEIFSAQGSPVYDFVLDLSRKFDDYGVEQQAEMIQIYSSIFRYATSPNLSCGPGSGNERFINCLSYLGREPDLKADFEALFQGVSRNKNEWWAPVLYMN